ncbi:MAG TPA: PAS domain S-box protein [Gemmatimonadales bacterium]
MPLIEQSPVGVVIARDGVFTYVNAAAVRLFGYAARDELEGMPVTEVVAPESRELILDRMMRRLRGEAVTNSYDYVALRRDGSRANVHMEVALLDLADGRSIVSYHMDVTDWRRSIEAARESEARFRTMADSAPVMMRVTDPSGEAEYLNRPWFEFTGQARTDALGRGWLAAIAPEDVRVVEEAIREAVHRRGTAEAEYRLRRRDGTWRWVLDAIAPRTDSEGAVIGLISSVVDVDERKQAEIADARLAAIVQSSDDAIVSKSLEGLVTSWNHAAERIFGYGAEEMVGSPIYRIIPPDLHGEEREIISRIARGQPVERIETERIRKDGTRIVIELTVSPVRDRSGRIVGAASIKRDVTERRRAEQRLRQVAKMEAIGRVAGGLAHDFNNQLHALRGFTDFVARDPNLGATAQADLLQVRRAADRMASLTRQLLAFSRRQVLAPETVDLDLSLAEMQPMLQRLIGSSAEMRVEKAAGIKWVRVDPAQLLQVVMNLAINARDAMPDGGEILIRTGMRTLSLAHAEALREFEVSPGEYAVLTVSDSGTGIDEGDLPQIFEPFFTTKGIGEGTGLGLATVQGIVVQSQGAIEVQSTIGQGTTFTIYLPSAPPPAPVEPARARGDGDAAVEGRILVVDDEDLVREVAARSLEQAGFLVQRARHGREALHLIESALGFDLVVSDVVMPVMGGRELGQRLTADYPHLPILWMSGHPREALPDIAGAGDEHRYLQKPVAPETLVNAVRRLLQLPGRTRR